jgi:uncharacterized membrane protein
MVRVYSALRKTIEFRKSKNQGKGIITMSENPNSLSDSPLSDPENFGIPPQPVASPDSSMPELIHSKVPFRPWLGESFVFAKRYFLRLFVLSLVVATLSFVGALRVPESESSPQSCQTGALAEGESPAEFEAEEPAAPTEEESGVPDASVSEGDTVEETATEETEAVEESDEGGSETAITETSDVRGVCGSCGPRFSRCFPSSMFWLFLVVASLVSWMIMRWAIYTARSDDASWKNLSLGSLKTVVKLFALSFIIGCLVGGGFLLVGGLWVWTALERPDTALQFETVISSLVAVILFLGLVFMSLRFSISVPIILDRDYGPLRALKTSYKFMRSNVWTLVVGIIFYYLFSVILTFVVIVPMCASLYGGGSASADPELLSRTISSTKDWPFALQSVSAVLNAFLGVGWISLFVIFYLMATGQRRLGAWPRDVEVADGSADDQTPQA